MPTFHSRFASTCKALDAAAAAMGQEDFVKRWLAADIVIARARFRC